MTGKASLDRNPAAPDAALVHLSGSQRGATEFISSNRIVLSPASDGGIELSTNNETPPFGSHEGQRSNQMILRAPCSTRPP